MKNHWNPFQLTIDQTGNGEDRNRAIYFNKNTHVI